MKEGRSRKKLKFTKEKLLYPTFVDIEVINLKALGFSPLKEGQNGNLKKSSKVIKYIPLLIYDDLLECMLQNLKALKEFEGDIIDPSFLLENDIIKLFDKEIPNPEQYSWLQDFNEVNIDLIMNSFEPTFPYDIK
jgi:hypothetical protein